jgi:hypothetical protein
MMAATSTASGIELPGLLRQFPKSAAGPVPRCVQRSSGPAPQRGRRSLPSESRTRRAARDDLLAMCVRHIARSGARLAGFHDRKAFVHPDPGLGGTAQRPVRRGRARDGTRSTGLLGRGGGFRRGGSADNPEQQCGDAYRCADNYDETSRTAGAIRDIGYRSPLCRRIFRDRFC